MAVKNKREWLQEIIDNMDEPWIIMKPSRHDPADADPLCVFENPANQTQAKVDIPGEWFQDGDTDKIRDAVQRSLDGAQPMYKDPI